MACQFCERPGLARVCFSCQLERRIETGTVPDFRDTLTEACRSCGGDLSPTEFRQKNCPYCGERP